MLQPTVIALFISFIIWSPTMRRGLFFICTLAAVFPAASAQANLVISEVLYNEIGSSANDEWIEIYNSGLASIDLSNFKIGDEETSGAVSTTEGMFRFPSGSSIGPGVVQVIAADASSFLVRYGFLPTYEVTGANAMTPNLTTYATWDPDTTGNILNMSNTNDQALILDGSDQIIDSVSWGNTFAFSPSLNADAEADGQSYERINPTIDTNTAADWRLGNPSSPGVVPSAVPEVSSFVFLALASALGSIVTLRRARIKAS